MKRQKPIIILAHVVNKTVVDGFLPAAVEMGHPVFIFTDQAIAHQTYFSEEQLSSYPTEIIACDVFNAQAIIETILQQGIDAAAIFSNSDYLQTACAQTASFFNLPAKNWQTCYRAKNKYAMREHLRQKNIASTWFSALNSMEELISLSPPFPCVVKPQQGVASMNVKLCETSQQLEQFCRHFWQSMPEQSLIIEEYIQGNVFTLETLGDGKNIIALGGFDVEISPSPYFVERKAYWVDNVTSEHRVEAFEQVKAFGVNFGSCHSEFILTDQGPRLIEINYRTIGGNKEFLLDKLASFNWFKQVLKLHLGEELPETLSIKGEAIAHYYTAEQSGSLMKQPEAFELHQPHYIKLEHLKNAGEKIELSHSDRDRLSILIAHSKQYGQIKESTLHETLKTITNNLVWEIS
ncbi:ATP-grasp domain-containing protein [Thalassotalea ganghwensis]